jgi:hypothetical protein
VILALVFGTLSVAVAHTGSAGLFHLNHNNVTSALTKLTGNVDGSAMQVVNNNADANDSALSLSVQSGEAPMRVNAAAGTATGLSADELDGLDSSELEPRGYAQVNASGVTFDPSRSKGIIDINRTSAPGNVYCFDLTFTPDAAVASANINNNATVGTVVGNGVPASCTAPNRDAAAITYAANDINSAHRDDINFGVVFM